MHNSGPYKWNNSKTQRMRTTSLTPTFHPDRLLGYRVNKIPVDLLRAELPTGPAQVVDTGRKPDRKHVLNAGVTADLTVPPKDRDDLSQLWSYAFRRWHI